MPNTPPSPLSPAPHIGGEPVSGGLQLTEEPEDGPPETIAGGARASTESPPPPRSGQQGSNGFKPP